MVSSGDTELRYLLENTSSALTSPQTGAVALSCTRTLASATGQTRNLCLPLAAPTRPAWLKGGASHKALSDALMT